MGGLRPQLPLTFWTYLIASASLSALPLVTAGFYSKDLILWAAWSSKTGGPWLWGAGLAGAFLTSLYSFRLVFLVFCGEPKAPVSRTPGLCMKVPLIALAALSLGGGLVELPASWGHGTLFSHFLQPVLPMTPEGETLLLQSLLQLAAALVSLGGIWMAYWFYLRSTHCGERWARTPIGQALHCLWLEGWGFDWLYDRLLGRPFLWIARANQGDFVDSFYRRIARLSRITHLALSEAQNGKVRWYAATVAIGAIVAIGIAVWL
jgi:NADH-quinone oxidoreductase subunit L